MNHDGASPITEDAASLSALHVQPLDLPRANCLDKLMKTPRAGLISVAAVVAINASSVKAYQPHMRRALEHLRAARAELQSAEHDKGGWRVQAIKNANQAIDDTERGMAFDRHH